MPPEEWKACLRSALLKPRVLSETGLEPAVRTLGVRDGGLDLLHRGA